MLQWCPFEQNFLLDQKSLIFMKSQWSFFAGQELEAAVITRDGPESFMKTSWVLFSYLNKEHAGTYYCIANNSLGESSTSSFISLSWGGLSLAMQMHLERHQ